MCSESLFILPRMHVDKMVVLDVRLAKADGLEALEQNNVGLLFGQLAQQASGALGQGWIGGAVMKQGLSARGGCLRSAATYLPSEGAAILLRRTGGRRSTWPAARPGRA